MNHSPYTILLLEDNPEDEELSLRALRGTSLSLCVKVAHDGAQAINALGLDGDGSESTVPPDLILSDLKMPKLNGREVLRRTRDATGLMHVPFVVFSSSDEPEDIAKCIELGADEYQSKPTGYTEFLTCVQGIVSRWLAPKAAVIIDLSSVLSLRNS